MTLLIEIIAADGARYYVNLLTTFPELEGKTLTQVRLRLDGAEVCGWDFRDPDVQDGKSGGK